MIFVAEMRHITESSNGRTTAFGAVYSGSNPGSVAIEEGFKELAKVDLTFR